MSSVYLIEYCSVPHYGHIFLSEIQSRECNTLGNYNGDVSLPHAYLLVSDIIPLFLLCL